MSKYINYSGSLYTVYVNNVEITSFPYELNNNDLVSIFIPSRTFLPRVNGILYMESESHETFEIKNENINITEDDDEWFKDHSSFTLKFNYLEASEPDYLCIEALESGFFYASQNGTTGRVPDLQYSFDKITWRAVTLDEKISPIDAGQKIYLKGYNAGIGFNTNQLYITIDPSYSFKASGSVMSLVMENGGKSGDDAVDETTIPNDYCFYRLFYGSKIVESPRLPATTLKQFCYQYMFYNCSSLITAPELPSITLADYCYQNMFYGCASLKEAPELPAINLTKYCYYSMFRGCSLLEDAPELPATTLASNCYYEMFANCTSLEDAPELPATTLYGYCYSNMFYNCTSLVQAPELPATTLASNCYKNMFRGCSSLKIAPKLPADTLYSNCYSYMFKDCTSLEDAPELPATNLSDHCYERMFDNCTLLKIAPELPATILSEHCYNSMFSGCESLEYPPTRLGANTLVPYCYATMFYNCKSLKIAPEILSTIVATYSCYLMFYNCKSLVSVPELLALNLADYCYYNMFYGCTNIKISTTKTGEYQNAYRIPVSGSGSIGSNSLSEMFSNTGGTFKGTPSINTTYYTSAPCIHWSIENNTSNAKIIISGSPINTGNYVIASGSFPHNKKFNDATEVPWLQALTSERIERLSEIKLIGDVYPVYMNYWFSAISNYCMMVLPEINGLTHVKGDYLLEMIETFCALIYVPFLDLSGLDVSKVRSMRRLFTTFGKSDTVNYSVIDITGWNTESLEDMFQIFASCQAQIDFEAFNTSKVTNMCRAFSNVGSYGYKPISLDLTSYDVSNVTDMSYLFNGCEINNINIAGWNTENVTNMSYMFYESIIDYIDLSQLNTSKVTTMRAMFDEANFENIDISSWDVSNCENTYCMFYNNSVVESISLPDFSNPKVTNMSYMFQNATNLTSLDLSRFSIGNVSTMNEVFMNCANLETIFVSEDWNSSSITSANDLFVGCYSIVGGSGQTYDSTRVGLEMANYETGYFTLAEFVDFLLSIDGPGTVIGPQSGTYPKGMPITLEAVPNLMCLFNGWFEDLEPISDDNPYTFSLTEDTSLVAKFSEMPKRKINITSNVPHASAYISIPEPYDGESIVLFARPEPGYTFSNWSDGSSANPRIIEIDGDVNLRMIYTADLDSHEIYQWRAFVKDQMDLTALPKVFLKLKSFTIRNDLLTTANSIVYCFDIDNDQRRQILEGDILVVYDPKGSIFYHGVITHINTPAKNVKDNINEQDTTYSIETAQMQHFYAGNTIYYNDPKSYLEEEIKAFLQTYASGEIHNSSYVDPLVAQKLSGISINAVDNLESKLPSLDENTVVNMEDFIYQMYEDYGIICDFDINYQGANTVTIRIPDYDAIKISNNTYAIRNLSPVTTISETNRLIIFDEEGVYRETWVATDNGPVKEPDGEHIEGRFPVVNTEIIQSDDEIEDLLASYLPSTMYNHKVTFDLRIKNDIYDYKNFKLGMPIEIYINGEVFNSVLTGWEINKEENANLIEIHMICGKVRTSLTNKLTRGVI